MVSGKMYVINRKHQREPVSYQRIYDKIKRFSVGLNVDCGLLTREVIAAMYPGITTVEIDRHTTKIAYGKSIVHVDYSKLAAALYVENIHRMTSDKFSEVCSFAQQRVDVNGNITPILDPNIFRWIQENAEALDAMIDHSRDYLFGYPAMQMAEATYMIRLNFTNTKPVKIRSEIKDVLETIANPPQSVTRLLSAEDETCPRGSVYGYECEDGSVLIDRPQYVLMRCCVQFYWDQEDALDKIKNCYDLMSTHHFTHPTPALINSCRVNKQLFSCFILDIPDDLDGIYGVLNEVANISKRAGGIAVNLSNVRSSDQLIRSTNGMTSETYRMLKPYNDTAEYVNQGGVRPGNIACYEELHHPEVAKILELRDPTFGDMKKKTLTLFYAMWGNDLFFKRLVRSVETGKDVMWSFFDPDVTPGLNCLHGEEYERLYLLYEKNKLYTRQIPVHVMYNTIIRCIYNIGNPYMCNKDAVNFKSNHQHRGTIKSSNLCGEINEYFDFDEPACCVLASLCLNIFVKRDAVADSGYSNKLMVFPQGGSMKEATGISSEYFGFSLLAKCTELLVHNLNQCIMKNSYPIDKLKQPNIDYKPLAIGVQGLAKALSYMRIPYQSEEGRIMNLLISETMYYAGLKASSEDASVFGKYKGFSDSPLGQGLLQFDMWQSQYKFRGPQDKYPRIHVNTNPHHEYYAFDKEKNLTLDWDSLRKEIAANGVANSLILSMMPTVSTSVFMNNSDSEAFEPFGTFFLQKILLYGSTVIFNQPMYEDLLAEGLWNDDFYQKLKDNFGLLDDKLNREVGGIIPSWMIDLYSSVWSPGMTKVMIERSRDRGAFVCQSQSLNLYIRECDTTFDKIHNSIIYAWKCGLKTLSYYVRSKLNPETTVSPSKRTETETTPDTEEQCRLIRNDDGSVSKSCCSG